MRAADRAQRGGPAYGAQWRRQAEIGASLTVVTRDTGLPSPAGRTRAVLPQLEADAPRQTEAEAQRSVRRAPRAGRRYRPEAGRGSTGGVAAPGSSTAAALRRRLRVGLPPGP